MKISALFAASMAAAASTSAALIFSAPSSPLTCNSNLQFSSEKEKGQENSATLTEKFAPKFDGLRFIETLITAHR
ncbi:CASP-like protein [Hibiscus syriacus]|uniref:CASP-like protein n=1 Tax=Hibiscus syriacus TaxID=106335 RepID=A0A6A2X583_HIBSY|nr:uncharacterized protein LOC120175365 [Hibiscus syriacus]KAE8670131.1 CASP-like protein [Hibiscus syriacus]